MHGQLYLYSFEHPLDSFLLLAEYELFISTRDWLNGDVLWLLLLLLLLHLFWLLQFVFYVERLENALIGKGYVKLDPALMVV